MPEDFINRLHHQPVARTGRRHRRFGSASTVVRRRGGHVGRSGRTSRIRSEHRVRLARTGRAVREHGSAEAAQHVFDQRRRGRLVDLILAGVLVEHMIVRVLARPAGVLVAVGRCRETGATRAAVAVIEEQRFLGKDLQAFVVARGVRQVVGWWTYANGDLE